MKALNCEVSFKWGEKINFGINSKIPNHYYNKKLFLKMLTDNLSKLLPNIPISLNVKDSITITIQIKEE